MVVAQASEEETHTITHREINENKKRKKNQLQSTGQAGPGIQLAETRAAQQQLKEHVAAKTGEKCNKQVFCGPWGCSFPSPPHPGEGVFLFHFLDTIDLCVSIDEGTAWTTYSLTRALRDFARWLFDCMSWLSLLLMVSTSVDLVCVLLRPTLSFFFYLCACSLVLLSSCPPVLRLSQSFIHSFVHPSVILIPLPPRFPPSFLRLIATQRSSLTLSLFLPVNEPGTQ